jgi:hypothetical protein
MLGNPAPCACRAEIAAFLWERGVFAEREGDATRAAPVRARSRTLRRWLGWAAAAAAAGLFAAAATGARVEVQSLPLLSGLVRTPSGR